MRIGEIDGQNMTGDMREIVTGIGFTEGPVWTARQTLVVTSVSRGCLYELDPFGDAECVIRRQIETGGGPNGLAVDAAGRMYVAQNGGAGFPSRSPRPVSAGLQLVDGDVVVDVAIPHALAPNDCAIGPDGALWFTDPGRDSASGPRVLRWERDSDRVDVVADDLEFPNGLAFSSDGASLYIADSLRHEIVRYELSDRSLDRHSVFASVPGAGPDGMAFDQQSRLYVAAFELDAVLVLDDAGRTSHRLATGPHSRPTNLCFYGSAREHLAVTLASGGRVVTFRAPDPGLALFS
jgi:gluconolactonase